MFVIVLVFLIFIYLPNEISPNRACVPNSSFILNGRLCYCDYKGRWSQASCRILTRRQTCQPGQVFWQGCNQCICSTNNTTYCTSIYCNITTNTNLSRSLSEYGERCIPFQLYYVNCSFCVCPASGKSSDAKCSVDRSCYPTSETMDLQSITKINYCIPNALYLFPCLQCPCSENGTFSIEKCVEKCQKKVENDTCISDKLYKSDCNICQCPKDGKKNNSLCTKATCYDNSKPTLKFLRSDSAFCTPRTFTNPLCLYCECLWNGTINENSCLELDCSVSFNYNNSKKDVCSPGDLVPICIECFCFSNGKTNETYCTRTCSYESKINILEKVLNDSLNNPNLIDKEKIREIEQSEDCEPNNVYLANNRYCICPKKADQKSLNKFCTRIIGHSKTVLNKTVLRNEYNITSTSNKSCEPNTLVDFDCNTCYCPKNGKIDPKWCTYDDCKTKRMTIEMNKSNTSQISIEDPNGFCTPGTISKIKCNFCICPESGLLQARACTKNNCYDNVEFTSSKFTCEPLTYYEVDCNICYCPHDGYKNVDKCTKNSCEKSYLRADVCVPDQLFSDDCNVCVCPHNGNKEDKVCTNNTCGNVPWNTFKLTNSLLDNEVYDDKTRKLDLCFPGEEFENGCDLCVCPELGLKTYATCERILCEDKREEDNISSDINVGNQENEESKQDESISHSIRSRRDVHDECFVYNISQSAERKECTPGSMYIIRCRQCICPYVGNINNFCRPLPKTFYCEEAFPGFNYMPMSRRRPKNASIEVKSNADETNLKVSIKHMNHTVHKCDTQGQISDECFICECDTDKIIIEEHCFQSDADDCINKRPTFLYRSTAEN